MSAKNENLNMFIENIASEFRKYYVREDEPIEDMRAAAEFYGCEVEDVPELSPKSFGHCTRNSDKSFLIQLPEAVPAEQKSYLIAVNLGRIFLYMNYFPVPVPDALKSISPLFALKQCQHFALAFLMPKNLYETVLLNFADENRANVMEMAAFFQLEEEAVITRGIGLKILKGE